MSESKVRRVESNGTRTVTGFVNCETGHYYGPLEVPTYPEVPGKLNEKLRELRRSKQLGLRAAAALVGVGAAEFSFLEQGAAEPLVGWEAFLREFEALIQ